MLSVESQKGVNAVQRCSTGREPEGCYRCTQSMALAPFWFSMETLLDSVNALMAHSQPCSNRQNISWVHTVLLNLKIRLKT